MMGTPQATAGLDGLPLWAKIPIFTVLWAVLLACAGGLGYTFFLMGYSIVTGTPLFP